MIRGMGNPLSPKQKKLLLNNRADTVNGWTRFIILIKGI